MNFNRNFKLDKYEHKSPVKKSNIIKLDDHNLFSFSCFNGKSVRLKDFNNYYANRNDAIKSISDFFNTLTIISNMKKNEICSNDKKKELHYNEFHDDKIIDVIENILFDGYGMSRNKIDDFERTYFEISFSNGKRVIGTKIYDNVFELLFIDCNHMVCIDSSRMIKKKMKYNYPGLFAKIDNNENYREYEKDELLKMLIMEAKNGEYNDINEFVNDCVELLNIKLEEKYYVSQI